MQAANPVRISSGRDCGRAAPSLSIDVFFDFICPWCLIGGRHLNAAMTRFAEMRADVHVGVKWHSCQLLPDMPPGGVDYESFYLARLGSAENVSARRRQVIDAGTGAGIDFRFDRIGVMPNTAAAHELIAHAAAQGGAALQASLIDSLFTAYFIEGEDIGDLRVLERRAVECGLERGGVREHLSALNGRRARHAPSGVSGVPLFVFDESIAVSGAASPDALLDAMLRSIRD